MNIDNIITGTEGFQQILGFLGSRDNFVYDSIWPCGTPLFILKSARYHEKYHHGGNLDSVYQISLGVSLEPSPRWVPVVTKLLDIVKEAAYKPKKE